ncbi:MAG: hypothetical protein AB8G11_16250 [Saprospiraceae bacterium]
MKKRIFGYLVLFAVVFTACNDITLRREDRMVGDWKFEMVREFDQFDVVGDVVTEDYETVRITFFEDRTMEYNENGNVFSGEWDLKLDNSGEESEFELIAFLLDSNGNTKNIIWDSVVFFNDKIRAMEQFDNGDWNRYRLIRN